jgi:hypothetical protein
MHDQSSSGLSTGSRRFANLFLCALLLVTATSAVQAQSGRRPPKQPTSPDPKPQSQPEPPVQSPTPVQAFPRLPILVVKNLPNVGTSSIYSNIALDGCLEELKQSPSVEVSSSKDKTRKEASDYAKASNNTWVVLIQLEQDVVDTEHPSVMVTGGDPRTLFVSYIVFTPGTGKVKTSGRIYQGSTRGGVGQPVPNTRGIVDYELRRCGRDAADRILDALNLPRPQRH